MLVNLDNYAETMEMLDKCTELIVDLETTGLNPWTGDRLVGIAIEGNHEAFYFPFRHVIDNLPADKMADFVKLLSKPDVTYVGYNYGFDLKFLYVDGVPLPKKIQCVQACAHLVNENEEKFKLKLLGDKYIEQGSSKEMHDLTDRLASQGFAINEMWKLPPAEVEAYACQDVALTRKLRDFYIPHLATWGLSTIWDEVNEYLSIIVAMECRGMHLNIPLIHTYQAECEKQIEHMRGVIEKLAGYPINLNSAKQLQAWLGIPSTAAEILEVMTDRPGVQELLDFRGWHRANANYYSKFLSLLDPQGILHPNLNITGTISGRLSASNPPMQAIPVRTEVYKVKDVVIPCDDDHILVEADYSQAELRVGSHYAQEKRMAEKLVRGADIHTETATEAGIPRDAAKRLNFSVIYGIGAPTLSERLGIPLKQAKQHLDKYHEMYPGFRQLLRRCDAIAAQRGYIRMFSGRLRRYNVEKAYTHKASSNLIQGSVAEMMRQAITKLNRQGHQMLLQVHDSIIFQLPIKTYLRSLPEIAATMNDTPWCTVPMKVDIKAGKNWGSMKKVVLTDGGAVLSQ